MSLRWDGGGVRLVRVGQYCLMGRRVLSRDTNRESAMACRGVFVSKGVHVLRVFYARKQLLPSARLSHCNSVCLSVTRVDQSKTVQARITNLHRWLLERLQFREP